MLLYKNLGRIAKTYYNVHWEPNEQHLSPGYINDPSFLYLREVESPAQYTIKFKNYDGKLLSSSTYAVGELPRVPSDPIRKSSSSYSYTFAGWKPDVATVTEDAEYIAVYSKVDMRATKHIQNNQTSNMEENLDGTDSYQ